MDLTTILVGIAGVLLPALLAKLKLNVPVIVPQIPPSIPQVPSVDEPLVKCEQLLDMYAAKTVTPDATDIAAMQTIKIKIDGVLIAQPKAA